MSAPQATFSKRAAPALSLNILSRATSLQIECLGSNKENYPEVSTPHLPKKTKFNSKTGLSLKKSQLSAPHCHQESDNPEEIAYEKTSPLTPLELPDWTPSEPKSALLRKKNAELSYCGEESSVVTDITNLPSQGLIERDYNDELYKRAEEYLDSQHLVIVLPEDHRRRPFGHLRVSTAKVLSSESGQSEFNSPSLISPSIHTASLLQRRSSSKKVDSDETPIRPKLALAKSPFYTCTGKGKGLFEVESTISKDTQVENEDDVTTQEKPNQGLSVLTTFRITGMSLRGSREPSEPSSATSFKMEEDSPLKIVI